MKQAVPYYRVSTQRQGQSGLGLEAQQQAVEAFARSNDYKLLQDFTEIETGRKNKRPLLEKALTACKKQKAVLLIARLDRLSRNVAFVSRLMEAGVEFKAVDNPYASKLVVHIMAAFAQHECELVSIRTKTALAAAKRRGVVLGRYGSEVLSKRHRENALAFALEMKPLLLQLQEDGYKTVRSLVKELNRRHVPTYHKAHHRWHVRTVHRLLQLLHEQERAGELSTKK